MTSNNAKPKRRLLAPLLLLVGFLWCLAAGQGLLPFGEASQYGLMVTASGLVILGLKGMRSGRRLILFMVILAAGGVIFATEIYYLIGDYRKFTETAPLRALLPEYSGDILLRMMVVSVMLLASCLFGMLRGRSRSGAGSGTKEGRRKRRPQTAPVKMSRTVRAMRR